MIESNKTDAKVINNSPAITDFVEVTLNSGGKEYKRKIFYWQGELKELKGKDEPDLDLTKDSDIDIDDFFFLVGEEARKIL